MTALSEEELNAELEKGYADMLDGRTKPQAPFLMLGKIHLGRVCNMMKSRETKKDRICLYYLEICLITLEAICYNCNVR